MSFNEIMQLILVAAFVVVQLLAVAWAFFEEWGRKITLYEKELKDWREYRRMNDSKE